MACITRYDWRLEVFGESNEGRGMCPFHTAIDRVEGGCWRGGGRCGGGEGGGSVRAGAGSFSHDIWSS